MTELPRAQAPILTATLNPALDLAGDVAQVLPNRKLRLGAPIIDPGGGGINIARLVTRLGGQALAAVSLGGALGAQVATLLEGEGIASLALPCPGDTRLSLAVTDTASGDQFRFSLPGPQWDAAQAEAALAQLAGAVTPGGWLALSGSNPPGVPAGFAADLAGRVAQAGGRMLADISGPPLQALASARARIAVLRLDRAEAEALAGRTLPRREDTARFARKLVRDGVAEVVALARGADGNILSDGCATWHARAVPVRVVSAVGAGDSFVAGLLLARARGSDWPEALALAAACATATCMQPATRLGSAEAVAAYLAQGRITPMPD